MTSIPDKTSHPSISATTASSTISNLGRMLLSHNFALEEDIVSRLSREEFAYVFMDGLSTHPNITCRQISHPHWIVEIQFRINELSPDEVGQICTEVFAQKRLSQKISSSIQYNILLLGGLKTTPSFSTTSDSLQRDDWGVDVVETPSAEDFLKAIAWTSTIAQKPSDTVFKICVQN